MLIEQLLKTEKITGTNCANCSWANHNKHEQVKSQELNKQGGLKNFDKHYETMSKQVDLVTLPGKATVKEKFWCRAPQVDNWVTERMCCALWDGRGVKRQYKGTSPIFK
jgi:hypothetical protein